MTDALKAVGQLVAYGRERGLIGPDDVVWTTNALLDALDLEPDATFSPVAAAEVPAPELEPVLAALLDDAVTRGVCGPSTTERDLLDTRLMGCLTPRPSDVTARFHELYQQSPRAATDYFYRLAQDSDYIRTYRIARDRRWQTQTPWGTLDITINLSKPEKDPVAIAAAKNRATDAYPRCLLCRENEGYAGRLDHPARETIRLVPMTLAGEPFHLQYSPYVYYNEHCIVLSDEHVPMSITRRTFERLLDFVGQFPHYTLGSNADLPIVGGSILAHEHYQGGRYEFPMARAEVRERVTFPGFEDVEAGIVAWPLSVIRIWGTEPERLVELADRVLRTWRSHSDPEAQILAETDGEPHNTITPIARRRGDAYELDLVLRNNRTTEEHPLGLFHPHAELHHIKKENIGLIEVMGLAVLPARLATELERVREALDAGEDLDAIPACAPHAAWARDVAKRHPDASSKELDAVLQDEVGLVFAQVLEQCGVFPHDAAGDAAFERFIAAVC